MLPSHPGEQGGWACIARYRKVGVSYYKQGEYGSSVEQSGVIPVPITSNRAELVVAIKGLRFVLKDLQFTKGDTRPVSHLAFFSSSWYVVDGVRRLRWRDHDRMTRDDTQALDSDLWSILDGLCGRNSHNHVTARWIGGRAVRDFGVIERFDHERCVTLAKSQAAGVEPQRSIESHLDDFLSKLPV